MYACSLLRRDHAHELLLTALPPRVQVVCNFCERHLAANKAAFADPRLELIINDAGAALEGYPDGSFDVIIGDLADPVEGGPCYQVRQFPKKILVTLTYAITVRMARAIAGHTIHLDSFAGSKRRGA